MWILGFVLLAVVWGALRAGGAVRDNYRTRRDAYGTDNPDAGKAARRAHAVGSLAATARYGPGAAYRGWKTGWSEGWGKGKELKDRYQAPVRPVSIPDADARLRAADAAHPPVTAPVPRPAPTPTTPPTPSTPPPTTVDPHPVTAARRAAARPAGPTSPDPTPGARNTMMAKAPALRSGAVASPEQLHAAIKQVADQLAAEVDDAGAGAGRANAEVTRTHNLTESSRNIVLPPADQALIVGLTTPAQQRRAAAAERLRAETAMQGLVGAALTMAASHVQLVGTAAGEFYNGGGARQPAAAAH
jgi:hypothetical protein